MTELNLQSRKIREVKHHVYVKRQTWISTTWPSLPVACRLLFIISRHKLVVSPNFFSIRIFWAVFICSFCILRNSQLESDVSRLSCTWSLNSLVPEYLVIDVLHVLPFTYLLLLSVYLWLSTCVFTYLQGSDLKN